MAFKTCETYRVDQCGTIFKNFFCFLITKMELVKKRKLEIKTIIDDIRQLIETYGSNHDEKIMNIFFKKVENDEDLWCDDEDFMKITNKLKEIPKEFLRLNQTSTTLIGKILILHHKNKIINNLK